MKVVLDASAVMALIMHEPGEDVVWKALDTALISSVNMAEVYSTCADRGLDPDVIKSMLSGMGHGTVEFTHLHALLAGRLRPSTRRLGLSLGDRACLATAMTEKCPVMTADKAWAGLDLGIEIITIR